MLRVIGNIYIEQHGTTEFPNRTAKYIVPVTEVECESSWKNLTDTCKLRFAKNIYYTDSTGKKVSWIDKPVVNSKDIPPLLLRGDKITVQLGYRYYDNTKSKEVDYLNVVFKGFVSNITPALPIEIECEDYMWKLKQIKTPNKLFKGYTLQSMLKELIGSAVTIESGGIETDIGNFRTEGETVAQVIKTLRENFHIECYIRYVKGVPTLRCSGLVYYPGDRKQHVFSFQKNVVDSNLEYKRKDDIKLGANAYSISSSTAGTNKDGSSKKKKSRLKVFVGEQGGETRTLYFLNVKTEAELKKLAETKLRRYYYEGYKGSFTAFGMPFVKHGDSVVIQDDKVKEKQGEYLVKGVTHKLTTSDGLRQEIELDLRIDGIFSQTDLNNGL